MNLLNPQFLRAYDILTKDWEAKVIINFQNNLSLILSNYTNLLLRLQGNNI